MQYQFILNEVAGKSTLTVVIGGVPTQVDDTHPAFTEIVDGLGTLSAKEIRELLDTNRRISKQLKQYGNVSVGDDGVTYKGEPVHGLLADRMLQMLEQGLDIRPWAMFIENLQNNPAKHAVDELFLWLERGRMPITERGNFLAYKKVQDDYCSYHPAPGGVPFRNDIGTYVSMPRNKVDDDRQRTCSQGLHFCSWDYLPSYMGSSGKVVIVEINPAHVVSIPSDYNNAKGRAEGYMIVGEIPQEECEHAFPNTLYVTDDNEYLDHEWEDDDGWEWFDEDWMSDCPTNDEDEELGDDAYDMGYSAGMSDGCSGLYAEVGEAFLNTEVGSVFYDVFKEGYMDGYYCEGIFNQTKPEVEEEERPTPHHWYSASIAKMIGTGKMSLSEFISEYEPDINQLADVLEHIKDDYGQL